MASPAPPRQPIQIARSNHTSKPGHSAPNQPAAARNGGPTTAKSSNKNSAVRLKVVIRRLPPGLTDTEFATCMGDEWKAGTHVDWLSYVPGKISKDPAKPSRPSRAYLHLTKQEYLAGLSEKVRTTSFADSKGSSTDSVLLGPPIVEFAPYGRVPTGKVRKDGRQGTIDQDQDFIDFLQELTNPITKPTPVDVSTEKPVKDEKVVTPLIQFLRDKKANKGKENTSGKGGKHGRQESKDSKSASNAEKKGSKSKENVSEKKVTSSAKIEKATKDAVKVLNKQAASKTAATAAPSSNSGAAPPASPAKPERKRERGNASAAAKILQRDLGLNGGPPGRRRRENSAAANAQTTNAAATKENVSRNSNATTAPTSSTASSTPVSAPSSAPKTAQAPTGPAANRNQQRSTPAATQSKPAATPAVNPTATQAFLKHANPSQGVTEPLLSEAFTAFGTVSKVEIDKKKGFAYIDFTEPEGLQKAIAASPVKVAQGQVVVLERKTGANLQNRNAKAGPPSGPARGGPMAMRGGRGRGRGGKSVDAAQGKASNPSAAAANTNNPTPTAPKAEAVASGPPP